MARVGGRNLAMSWIAALLCAGVVAGLIWLAAPMGPMLVDFMGDVLRTVAPSSS